MATASTYDILENGKIFADYGKSGFNFENCRRYVLFDLDDLCYVIFYDENVTSISLNNQFYCPIFAAMKC